MKEKSQVKKPIVQEPEKLEVSVTQKLAPQDPQKLDINMTQKPDKASKTPRAEKTEKRKKESKEKKEHTEQKETTEKKEKERKMSPRKAMRSPRKQVPESVAAIEKAMLETKQEIDDMAKNLSTQLTKQVSRKALSSRMSGSGLADLMSSRQDSFSPSIPGTLNSSEWRRMSPEQTPSPEKPQPKSKVRKMEPVLFEKSEGLTSYPSDSSGEDLVRTDVQGHETQMSSVSVVFSPKKKTRASIPMNDMLYGEEKTLHTVEVTDMELKLKKEIFGTDESDLDEVEEGPSVPTVERLEVRAKQYPKPENWEPRGKHRKMSNVSKLTDQTDKVD